ncbi:MAG: flagellar motor protein MotB [Schwartzia sp. (in: firmicutes)]
MAKKKHSAPHEEEASEAWLLPYSDLMTLLLALFLCLFCMSQTDDKKVTELAQAFHKAFSVGSSGISLLTGAGMTGSTSSGTGSGPMEEGANAYILENQTLEQLQQTLDEYIRENHLETDLQANMTEDGLLIRIKEKALFPSGSAELVPESQLVGPVVAGLLGAIPQRVIISGHTDNVPINTAQYPSNWELSSARALNFMKSLFAANPALNPARFSAIGYSEYRPAAPNATEEGRTQNRRVEILIARTYQMAEGTLVAR